MIDGVQRSKALYYWRGAHLRATEIYSGTVLSVRFARSFSPPPFGPLAFTLVAFELLGRLERQRVIADC